MFLPPGSAPSALKCRIYFDSTEAAISLFFHRSDRKTPNRLKQEINRLFLIFLKRVYMVHIYNRLIFIFIYFCSLTDEVTV